MTTTSISLLRRLRQPGDKAAWERFLALYTPLLLTWARKISVSTNDAEDLVQEVLVVLLKELPKFEYDAGKSFRGWLRTVISNRGRDFLRQQNRQPAVAGDLGDLALAAHDSVSEADYRRHLVGRALELMQTEFEESTWRACWECVVNDRAAADVSQQLGITINAVYVAKSRVMRRLRQELAGMLD